MGPKETWFGSDVKPNQKFVRTGGGTAGLGSGTAQNPKCQAVASPSTRDQAVAPLVRLPDKTLTSGGTVSLRNSRELKIWSPNFDPLGAYKYPFILS